MIEENDKSKITKINLSSTTDPLEGLLKIENNDLQQTIKEAKFLFSTEMKEPNIALPNGERAKKWFHNDLSQHHKNLLTIRQRHPEKLAKLFCEIYANPFQELLVKKFHKEDFLSNSTDERIKILSTIFERSYELFGIIALSSIDLNNEKNSLPNDWEFLRRSKTQANFKNQDQQEISGKKWAIINSNLFPNPTRAASRLKLIRDKSNHDSLKVIQSEGRILFFDDNGKKEKEISIEEFNNLYELTLAATQCATQFTSHLFFTEDLWLDAYFYGMANNKEFIPRLTDVASILKKEESKDGKKFDLSNFSENVMPILLLMMSFLHKDIWKKIQHNKIFIDEVLASQNLKLSDHDLKELEINAQKSLQDFGELIFIFLDKEIKEDLFSKKTKSSYTSKEFAKLITSKGQEAGLQTIFGLFLELSITIIKLLKALTKDMQEKLLPIK